MGGQSTKPESKTTEDKVSSAKSSSGSKRQQVLALLDAGIALFERVYSADVALDDSQAALWFKRGNAYYRLGDFNRAVAGYTRAIQLAPTDALWFNRGVAYQHVGNLVSALSDYSEAIRLAPTDTTIWRARASVLDDLGEHARAIADCTEALRLDPALAVAWQTRAIVHRKMGQFSEAIADHTAAIRLQPTDSEHWHHRGAARAQASDRRGAIRDYNTAMWLNPTDHETYFSRGLAQTDPDRQICDYTVAIRLKPDYREALENRGGEYMRQHRVDLAIADYRSACRCTTANEVSFRALSVAVLCKQYNLTVDTDQMNLIVRLITNCTEPTMFQRGVSSVTATLGGGAFKTVLHCVFQGVDVVICQLLNDRHAALFQREFALLRSLKHPNVMNVHGELTFQGRPSFASEFHSGGSLERRLFGDHSQLWPSVRQQLLWARDLCRALQYLHSGRKEQSQRTQLKPLPAVLHRDVKSANAVISADNRLVLIDFGLAVEEGEKAQAELVGQGTAQWMSPEAFGVDVGRDLSSSNSFGGAELTKQISKPSNLARARDLADTAGIGTATDVWSFGCLLIELFAAVRPWAGLKQADIVSAFRERRTPPDVQRIENSDMRALCQSCLELLTSARPSAETIVSKINALLDSDAKSDDLLADMTKRRVVADQVDALCGGCSPSASQLEMRALVEQWLAALGFRASESKDGGSAYVLPWLSDMTHIGDVMHAVRDLLQAKPSHQSFVELSTSVPAPLRRNVRLVLTRMYFLPVVGAAPPTPETCSQPFVNRWSLPAVASLTPKSLLAESATVACKLLGDLQAVERADIELNALMHSALSHTNIPSLRVEPGATKASLGSTTNEITS